MTTFFETARLRARRFAPSDLAAFAAYRADPEVALYQSWTDYTASDAAALIEQMEHLSPGVPGKWVQLALEHHETGALVGDLALRADAAEPRVAEVGFTLAREHQGHGYGLESLRGLLEHAFTDLRLHRVFAATDPRNEPSARLLTRVGMRQEAHHVQSLFFKGMWADDLVFAMLASEWPRCRATDPAGLRAAWAALERAWDLVIQRVTAMPAGTVDVSVDGEWSFAQTQRHLVMAIDTWLGGAILEREQPYHPIGQPHAEYALDGHDPAVFSRTDPSYDEVLAVRAERMAMVRDYLRTVTAEDLTALRRHPWSPDREVTVLACLHVILNEGWEHRRFAVRDLDAIATRRG